MTCFYITDVDKGRVNSTASGNRAAQLARASGFFFNHPSDLEHPEFGGPYFKRLQQRFLEREGTAEELFDVMTKSLGAVVQPFTKPKPKFSKRRTTMSEDKVKIDENDLIKINKEYDGRPRRPGTNVAKIFDAYRDGIKVSTWLDKVEPLGGGISNLRKDIAYGRVYLEQKAA